MRWAYFSSKAPSAQECASGPCEAFAHITKCGKWSYVQHTHKGVKGVLAFWKGPAPGTGELGEGVQMDNGLIYFAPDKISQADLAKRSPYPAINVIMHKGFNLSIPLAVAGPRSISFTGCEIGGFTDDFPEAAAKLNACVENLEDEEDLDPQLINLAMLAIQQTYSVTPELLEDLGWITTIDLVPIFRAVIGVDPFPLSGESDTSNSVPQESNENQCLPQESGI
jgi:hypothetical protein